MRTVHVLAAVAGLLLAGCADDAPRQAAPGSSVPGSTSTTEQTASLGETVSDSELLSVDDFFALEVWAKQPATWRMEEQRSSRDWDNTETLGFLRVHSCPDPADAEMELNLGYVFRDLNDVEAAEFSDDPWAPTNHPPSPFLIFIAVYADSATNIAAAYDEIVGVLDHCIRQPSLPGMWTWEAQWTGHQVSLSLPSVGEASFGIEFGLDLNDQGACRHWLALVRQQNRLLLVESLVTQISETEFIRIVERSVEHLAV